ncbi:MAG: MFS transporter [Rhodospirillales bacterium]
MKLFQGRLRWVLIFWMFLISAIAYLDRVNISIAGQAIQKDFNLDDIQLGLVFSAFVLGYALFQVPGGRMADRFGPRRILLLAVIWWGIFTSLTAATPTSISFAVVLLISMRFLLGIGEAVVYPASNSLVARWIPSAERGIANGLIFAGVGAGAGVTPPLITWILVNWGWHVSFYVSALIGLVAGFIWYWLARDNPDKHPWITQKELEHIKAGLPPVSKAARGKQGLPMKTMLTSKNLLSVSFAYSAYGYVAYIFFTWFFIYLSRVRGLDLKSSAFYGMLPFIAMATCSPLGGAIADALTKKHGSRIGRCAIGVVGMGFAAVFLALATQVSSAVLASFVLAGGAGCLYLSQSSFWAVTADIAGPSAGSVSGMMNMCNQICGAITASLTPWIANNYGWTASFLTAATICGLGALAWLFVNPAVRIGEEKA